MSKTVKIAMIGTGDISGIYLKNITETFHEIELTGVCDLVREKAEAAAKKWNVPRIYKDMYEAFDDPQVDIILNLTRPDEHYAVTKPALLAGKHVYSEKPLAATFELGQELVQIAKEKGLFLGGAPDTFLGAGIQTCRKLIDDGFIGDPVGAGGLHDLPRPRGLASGPGVLLQARRRTHAGHGTVLRHGAGEPAGRRAQPHGPHQDHLPAPHHHQRAQARHGHHRGRADLRHRHHGL